MGLIELSIETDGNNDKECRDERFKCLLHFRFRRFLVFFQFLYFSFLRHSFVVFLLRSFLSFIRIRRGSEFKRIVDDFCCCCCCCCIYYSLITDCFWFRDIFIECASASLSSGLLYSMFIFYYIYCGLAVMVVVVVILFFARFFFRLIRNYIHKKMLLNTLRYFFSSFSSFST